MTDTPKAPDLKELFPDNPGSTYTPAPSASELFNHPADEWGPNGLLLAVDHGTARHWRLIAAEIHRDPFGLVAETIETATMWDSVRFGVGTPRVHARVHVIETLLDVIQAARGPSVVEELTPDVSGLWIVHTQGSSHVWDLDQMTYERRPGNRTRSRKFAFDSVPHQITRVDIWPKVRSYFRVWYDDPHSPSRVEQFRQSSLIRMIQRQATDEGELNPQFHT